MTDSTWYFMVLYCWYSEIFHYYNKLVSSRDYVSNEDYFFFLFPISHFLLVGSVMDPQQTLLWDLWADEVGSNEDSTFQSRESHCP